PARAEARTSSTSRAGAASRARVPRADRTRDLPEPFADAGKDIVRDDRFDAGADCDPALFELPHKLLNAEPVLFGVVQKHSVRPAFERLPGDFFKVEPSARL